MGRWVGRPARTAVGPGGGVGGAYGGVSVDGWVGLGWCTQGGFCCGGGGVGVMRGVVESGGVRWGGGLVCGRVNASGWFQVGLIVRRAG